MLKFWNELSVFDAGHEDVWSTQLIKFWRETVGVKFDLEVKQYKNIFIVWTLSCLKGSLLMKFSVWKGHCTVLLPAALFNACWERGEAEFWNDMSDPLPH